MKTTQAHMNKSAFKQRYATWLKNLWSGDGAKVYREHIREIIRSVAPKPRQSPDVWADTFRYLTKGSRPGKWNSDVTPYMREPCEAFLDESVETIVLMWSTQVGKTAYIENVIGAVIHQYPAPMYFVMPDENLIRDFKQEKLEDMFEATPLFYKEGLVKRASPGKSDTTDRKIRFNGGYLAFASSNSMSALAGRSIRFLFLDEVDRFKVSKGEGDVLVIAKNRTNSYAENRKIIITSTPTDTQNSRINKAFIQGDQRRFHVECPRCAHVQHLIWSHVEWDKTVDDKGQTTAHHPDTAYYRCAAKGCRITHGDKPRVLRSGIWIPTVEAKDKRLRSYHLNVLYSPFVSFEDVVRDYLAAKDTPGGLRAFFNTAMAEVYDDPAEQPQYQVLFARAEDYEPSQVPKGVGFLTAGVDIQEKGDGRLEISVWGWGRNGQRWLVDHKVLPGSYKDPETWATLDEHRHEKYMTEDGRELSILRTLVDSSAGNTTNYVYAYCLEKLGDGVFAVKGANTPHAKLLDYTKLEKDSNGKAMKGSITLFRPNVTQYKKWLYHSINEVTSPEAGHYVHTPKIVGANWHRQLCAEKIVYKGTREEFIATYANEALDCSIYAHAAAESLNLTKTNWDDLFRKQGALVETPEKVEIIRENVVEIEIIRAVQIDKTWYKPGEIIVVSMSESVRLCSGKQPFAHKTSERPLNNKELAALEAEEKAKAAPKRKNPRKSWFNS